MTSSVISDHISQIKRFKGRGKFELYLHNREFRILLSERKILLPDENLGFSLAPGKKYLSKSRSYLKMLQKLFCYLEIRLTPGYRGPDVMVSLNQKFDSLIFKYGDPVDLPSDKRQYTLEKVYVEILGFLDDNLTGRDSR